MADSAIVVQNFNKPDTLGAVSESLLACTNTQEYDLIFWSDSATGARKESEYRAKCAEVGKLLDSFFTSYRDRFRSITLRSNSTNLGCYKTCQLALDHAFEDHDFVIFCEDDVVFSPDALDWFAAMKNAPAFLDAATWAIAGESIFFDAQRAMPAKSLVEAAKAHATEHRLWEQFIPLDFIPSTCFATDRWKWAHFSVTRGHVNGDVELCLDTGNHGFFANSGEPLVLHPDLTDGTDYPTREAGSCMPFVWDEARVRPVWQRLAERAEALGHTAPMRETTTDPGLCVVAKGRMIRPLHVESGVHIFTLPRGAIEVRLVSRAASPADTRPWLEDRRCLGVYVERILLRGASEMLEIPLDHPALSEGWWTAEQDGTTLRRWTAGDAVLPLPPIDGPTMLEIRAGNAGMAYLTATDREDRRAA